MRESIQRYVDNETGIKWIPVPGHKPRVKKRESRGSPQAVGWTGVPVLIILSNATSAFPLFSTADKTCRPNKHKFIREIRYGRAQPRRAWRYPKGGQASISVLNNGESSPEDTPRRWFSRSAKSRSENSRGP